MPSARRSGFALFTLLLGLVPGLAGLEADGAFRVLSLGDSMTHGIEVQRDEAFSAVLQRHAGEPVYAEIQRLGLLNESGQGGG